MKKVLFGLALVAAAAFGNAQKLSEIVFNPPGADQGFEAVEITGTPGASLAGLWLIAIEGDGTARGVVDIRQDLGSYTFGSNGVLLIRDAATSLVPAPEAGTNVVVFDWSPDIENGTNTYILGSGLPVFAAGADLDTDNNGTIDAALGLTVLDAVSFLEDDELATAGSNSGYAAQLGGIDMGVQTDFVGYLSSVSGSRGFSPDFLRSVNNAAGDTLAWSTSDIIIGPNGEYLFDIEETGIVMPGGVKGTTLPYLAADPGVRNAAAVALTAPVTVNGLTGGVYGRRLLIQVLDANDTVIAAGNYLMNDSTNLTFHVPAISGPAKIVIDGDTVLRRVINVNLNGANQTLPAINIGNGDVDNSTEVDLTDIDLAIGAYLTSAGVGLPFQGADVDVNGEVDLTDIDVIIANYLGSDDL